MKKVFALSLLPIGLTLGLSHNAHAQVPDYAHTAMPNLSFPMSGSHNISASNTQSGPTEAEVEHIPLASLRPSHQSSSGMPSSQQTVNMTAQSVNDTLSKAQAQVDSRLSTMALTGQDTSSAPPIGPKDGVIGAPDTAPYNNELQDLANTERKIRLLTAKQKEADLTVKLWGTLFDAEKEAKASPSSQAQQSSKGTGFQPNIVPSQTIPVVPPVAQRPDNGGVGVKAVKDTASTVQSVSHASVLPKVYQVSGSGQNIVATLLVPYQGEEDVHVGDALPYHRKVVSISPSGDVVIQDGRKGHVTLLYGTSVPGH